MEVLAKRPDLCVIDAKRGKVIDRVAPARGLGTGMRSITPSQDGKQIFATTSLPDPFYGPGFPASRLLVVDSYSLKVVDEYFPLQDMGNDRTSGFQPLGMSACLGASVVFAVLTSGRSRIVLADIAGKSWRIVSAEAPRSVGATLVSRDGTSVWALGKGIARLDMATGRVQSINRTVGRGFPSVQENDLILSPDGQTLHIIDRRTDGYVILDAISLRVMKRIGLGMWPTDLAMTADGGAVWLLVRHPLPRRPTTPPPDRPAEIWRFDSRGRELGRVVLPEVGGAESLVLSRSGLKGNVAFRQYPGPAEILVLRRG